jgi:nucleoside recognition membrane protein YjiH
MPGPETRGVRAYRKMGMKLLFMFAHEHVVLTGFIVIVILAWLSPILLGAVFIRERRSASL